MVGLGSWWGWVRGRAEFAVGTGLGWVRVKLIILNFSFFLLLELRHMTIQLAGSFPAAFWRLSGGLLAAFRQHAGSSPSHVTRHVTAAFTTCVPLLHPLLYPLSFPSSL